jgi:tetratricopeptide (TPR) repeat protein
MLGGGAWVVAGQLKPAPQPTAIAPTPDAPAPSAAPEVPEAAVEAPAAPSAAQAEAPQPTEPEPAEEAPAPEPAAAAAAPAKAAAGKPETKPEAAPSESASNGRDPKDYSGWVSRGDKLLKQGDLPGAQQAFEQAVAMRGTGSEANSGLGAALLAQGQTREAIPYLTRAAGNGFAEASVGLGDAYRKLGQKDAAIEAYETYLARLPKGARASYVKLQLEGLGQDVGGSNKPAPSEPAAPAQDGYRPAGELEPSGTAP